MIQRVKAISGNPLQQVVYAGSAHFAMIEKVALHNLDELMQKDMQAARLVMSLIRLMEPGSGGVVVISRAAIAELLGVSMPTVQRALKTLVEGAWVQRIRIGGAYALAINNAVAWVGPRGQMDHAVFNATVVASRAEQDKYGLEPGELRQIPIAHPDEAVLPVGIEPDPPSQSGLEGVPPVVAHHGEELEKRGQSRLID